MTSAEFLAHVQHDKALRDRLVSAVKEEWGDRGVDSAEPYLTNGAWRAVYAVMTELARLAPTSKEETRDAR